MINILRLHEAETAMLFCATRENVRLTFDHKVEAVIQEIVDTNFELYKRITDDRSFGENKAKSLERRGYGLRRVDQALMAAGIEPDPVDSLGR